MNYYNLAKPQRREEKRFNFFSDFATLREGSLIMNGLLKINKKMYAS